MKTKAGQPVARKQDLIRKQRERIARFVDNPGALGHDPFWIRDDCDGIRTPAWWAVEEPPRH